MSFVPPGRSRIGVVPRRTAELPGGGVLESFQPLPQGIYRVQVEEVQGSRSWTGEVRISSAKGATAKVELCSPSFIDEREIRRLMYTLKRLERQRAKRTEKQLERLGYGEGGPDEEH